jgi:hypothetical protein
VPDVPRGGGALMRVVAGLLGLVGAAGLLGLVGASIALWVETVRLIGA